MFGQSLLSRVCDENDVAALKRYDVQEHHFATEQEKRAYRYIIDYAENNGGKAPDGAWLDAEISEGFYTPNEMTYEHLAKRLKDDRFIDGVIDLFSDKKGEIQRLVDKEDSDAIKKLLTEKLETLKLRTSVRNKTGTSLKNDVDSFLNEYNEREAGESFKVWRSKFERINEAVGGYTSGNVYAWYGRSGRGKSVITTEEAIESAMQGATVLFWSMEMPRYEVLARMYTSLSAREGLIVDRIEGIEQDVGFNNRDLRLATLSDEHKAGLRAFLLGLNESMPGDIILRAVDDDDFTERTVRELEGDIERVNADVVVIDPIYYMDFERNTSKTKGGDIAATSKRLRRLAGNKRATIHVITQADEVADEQGEDGERELRPPKRKELSKSKAILQDAALTLGIDTLDGQGIIQLNKGRDGGEGAQVELTYLPNYGIVRDMSTELPF